MTARQIGLIGSGAIAADVAAGLVTRGYQVLLYARSSRAATPDAVVFDTMEEVLAREPDLVVEAASQTAVRDVVPMCLQVGRPVVVSSVGALADEALFDRLTRLARDCGSELILPSGAIGGLDYVRAARLEPETDVSYESRKPLAAWQDELRNLGIEPATLASPFVLFEGDAREAAARYPANLNVAATLALAGQGFARTRVRVVVDPAASANTHTIAVRGPLGTLEICIANKAARTNPKSSLIVARSILACVDQYFSPVKML